MSSFPRREIPCLISRRTRVGKAGTLRRSFPTGYGEYFRIYDNEPLHLEVEILEELQQLALVLHTNFGANDSEWQDVEFRQIDARRYVVDVPTSKCGLFRFKLKYTLDGGSSWYWDRVPYSEVLVDPAGTRCIRMYTMIPTVSGHIGDWKNQLHRIREMNFNAVHLLPVTQMGISESPYAADELFALDPSYLDPADDRPGLDQFEDFVETARALDVRLCLDLVLNHVGISSSLVKTCPDWIASDEAEPDGFRRAGCWYRNSWLKWMDLAKIDYEHPQRNVKRDIWDHMTEYALFWSNYANYTGGMVRFDNLHSSHEGFIAHCTGAIRREFPNIMLLAEFFSDQQTLERKVPEWGLTLLLANAWEYRFAPQLREYISFLHNVSGKLRHFTPITSHDTGSPAQEFGGAETTSSRYFVVALFTMGQTGIVQGVEHAAPEKVEFIGRSRRSEPLDGEPIYAQFIAKINGLLKQYEVFSNSGNLRFVDGGHETILAAVRLGKFCGENDVLLLANLDIHSERTITVDLASLEPSLPLRLKDMLGDEHAEMTGTKMQFSLKPSAVRAFELQEPKAG